MILEAYEESPTQAEYLCIAQLLADAEKRTEIRPFLQPEPQRQAEATDLKYEIVHIQHMAQHRTKELEENVKIFNDL